MTSQSATQDSTPDAAIARRRAETPEGFDVREFARTARGNHRSEMDLSGLRGEDIDDDAAHLIRTLRDLEASTMHRMRNLLVTATHKDARVTAFLTTWAFERFWIADALNAVLEASGHEQESPAGPTRRTRSERADRRGPVARAVFGNIAGAQLVAAHVTVGLIDEWVTSAAYRRLGELAGKLHAVIDMIIGIKDRHVEFFAEEAQRRLAESAWARRLAAKTVKQTAWPVGATERPAADRSFFEAIVFGAPAGTAEAGRIAALVAALPGMASVAPTVAARLVP